MLLKDLLPVFLIALGLSADCFAVALSGSIAIKKLRVLRVARTAASFGFFQAAMPAIGWLGGRTLVNYIGGYDHWLAFALLAFIGGRMLWEAFHDGSDDRAPDITAGWSLVVLSIATSIDALAVGLTFAFLDINILWACAIIGIVAFFVTATGFLAGRKLGSIIGKRAEIVGGLILIGIGLRILLTHVL